MSTVYLCIVIFLLFLAVFDLFVGVSNDAVNFLQSAIGAKVATFRTVLIVASCGVMIGAVMSSGMMDVARHGIMMPDHYSFAQVMTIFLAVMTTDVIVLDVFNTLGMPTSTTVSLVFELLGGTFALAVVMMSQDSSLTFADLLNTEKAFKIILAIFVSVAVAFFFGALVQWITRLFFTFDYQHHSRYTVAIFGGIAFTALAYFIFMKGLGSSPYISETVRAWINGNINMLILCTFLVSTIVMEVLHLCKVNIFKFVVLMGTFALAMAFAGNDLVNFIGVPLAGLSSYQDFMSAPGDPSPTTYLMKSLMESAKTPPFYLMLAGIIMIIAMGTSKKARNVIKTSVDLSRQDEGDEMFGSSRAARGLVRFVQMVGNWASPIVPRKVSSWVNSRFSKPQATTAVASDGEVPAFDVVRAAVNLVLAAMVITIGTNLGLPLSTTYVTFMVAMGTSLADRAWGRESAVFRITGVLSVIGGWFITAGVAFFFCAVICLLMYYGGLPVQVIFVAIVVWQLYRSNFKKNAGEKKSEDFYQLMMRTRDPFIIWDLLKKHVRHTQSSMTDFVITQYNLIVDGFETDSPGELRRAQRHLAKKKDELRKLRRQELIALRKTPKEVAMERNTWFHVSINACTQYIYCLRRMLEPIKEHVDNNFMLLPQSYIDEYRHLREHIVSLLKSVEDEIATGRFETYRDILAEADQVKDELSVYRKKLIDRLQASQDNKMIQVSLVYLNLLQESQQLLSNMRHQLRGSKKFLEDLPTGMNTDDETDSDLN